MPAPDPLDDRMLALAMHDELRALLDAVPASRRVLTHVALVEKMLVRDGLQAIEALPEAALERACLQMQGLPITERHAAMLQLRELLGLALSAVRRRQLDDPDSDTLPFLPPLPALDDEDPNAPREATTSEFMRAQIVGLDSRR